jgi:hypothetical protein
MGHMPLIADREFSQDEALLYGIGRLVCAWGMLEQGLEEKLVALRKAAGDVRAAGVRAKPGMGRLMAELRAMISMRDRRNPAALAQIADIECDIQRIDRFRGLIISGFQSPEGDGFACRDHKNNVVHVTLQQLDDEIVQLEQVGDRLMAL